MTATATRNSHDSNARRHAAFVVLVALSIVAFHKPLNALRAYSLNNASSSHIVLIPVIALFLLYFGRQTIFPITSSAVASGISLGLGGIVLYWFASRPPFPQDGNWPLAFATLSIVLLWLGLFLLCYGFIAFRAALFPLLFLLLMVPLPEAILDRIIYALQAGSTEIAYLIFEAVGMPVIRHGFILSVPGVTIEVAQECSSIRSSIALFITCLLAAHLYLRTGWKMLLFALLSLPLSLAKNGIRIATLTLLSIYINPGFLTGRLHREGGIVFFLVSLLLLAPVFLWLERSDKPRRPTNTSAPKQVSVVTVEAMTNNTHST